MVSLHKFVAALTIVFGLYASDVHAEEPTEPGDATTLVRARDFGPGLARAREQLKKNYAGIIEREELGFDHTLVRQVVDDLRDTVESEFNRSFFEIAFEVGAPLLVFVLILVILGMLDERSHRVALRRQAKIEIHGANWVDKLVRAGVTVLGRSAPVALLIMLSYFPVQAIYGSVVWPVLLTELLWLYLGFRIFHAAVVSLFAFRLFDVSDATAQKLQRWGLWVVRVVFFWMAALVLVYRLGYRGDVSRFVEFLSVQSLVAVAIGLARLKPEVLEVLRLDDDDDSHAGLLRSTEKYYQPFMGVTVVLLMLGAFGWVEASTFILLRAYGAIVVTFMSLRISQWMKGRIEAAVERAQTREQIELFGGIGSMVRTGGYIFFFYVAIRLLRLWQPLETLLDIPILLIGTVPVRPKAIFESILFLVFAVFVGRLIRAFLLVRVYPILKVDVGVGYAINTLINYAVIMVGFMLGLAALGVDFSSLTVVMASLGVGIGLGLQSFTENLVSGFILLFGRSVKKGDIITVGDVYGRVDDVGARSVVIKTADNYDMLIPSKSLVSGEVINWSYRDPLIRLRIPIGVSYSSNPRDVQRVLMSAARSHNKLKRRPAPEVLLSEFGDNSVNYELLVYYDIRSITRDRLLGQMNFIIWDKLAEANIEIPFPQRDLHLRSIDPKLASHFARQSEE